MGGLKYTVQMYSHLYEWIQYLTSLKYIKQTLSAVWKFSRLKHLDLSKNNHTSLQGLEHLQLLEKLNLYYNNIESLEELKRLKFNPNLKAFYT
ncbi:hypothetical protein DPMN_194658 [Dreissena polymorpha]|uniref:Uncharacterized protein n=1 Tax=Dreissena polymorpha TaxID=45954 RepID=A0A9D3Y089_DREPO|nr:hypothetical protein DPMN_194658 [Dreissena polymorpha]